MRGGRAVGALLLVALPYLGVRPASAQIGTPADSARPVAAAPSRGVAASSDAAGSATASDTLRLGLSDAVRLAADRSAQVAVARSQVEEARARVGEARSVLLPQVNAQAQRTGRTFNTATFGLDFPTVPGQPPLFDPNGQVEGPVDLTDVRGSLSQTLFDWAAIQRVRGAKRAVAAERAGASAAAEGAATAAARAYVQAQRSEARHVAVGADVRLARELVGIAQDMLKAGLAVKLDVTRAQAQLAAMNARLVSARNDASQSKLALLRSLNLPLDTPVALADSLSVDTAAAAAVPAPDSAVAVALRNRADLLALERRVDATKAQVSAVKAERLPRLQVMGDDGWIGQDLNHMLPTYDWAVAVQVPVFDGLRRESRIDAAQAQVDAVQAQGRDLRERVSYEVRSALLNLTAAAEGAEAARTRLELAQEELDQARERFRAGVAGTADVITASLRLSEARTAYVDATSAYGAARVALAAAQGTVQELP